MPEVSRRSVLKYGLSSAAALLTVPLLASCSSIAGTSGGATSGEAKISLWTHDKGYQEYFTDMAKRLNAAKSTPFTYTLKTTIYDAESLVTKLLAAESAGRGAPAMVGIEIGGFPRFMSNGIAAQTLESWDSRIVKVKDDLIQSRLAPFSVDGHVYALDSDNPLIVYYYREDDFKKYGIPDPETWEEFAQFGASFHQRTGISLVPFPTGPGNGDVVNGLRQFLLQRGGHFFDEKGKLVIDSEETVDTINFITQGLQSGFMIGLDNMYGGPIQAGFKAGTILGAAMPDWYNVYGIQATVPEQKGQWRIRPLPKFAKGGFPTSILGGTGFTAVKGDKNATAVMDLIAGSFLTTQGQVQRFKDIGYLPTLKSAYETAELKSYEDPFLGGQKTFEVYSALADKAPADYQSPNGATLTNVFGGPLLDAFRGKVDAKTAIKETVSAYKQQVAS